MDYTTVPVTTDALKSSSSKAKKNIICDGEIIARKQNWEIPTIREKQRLLIIIRIVKSLPFTFTTKGHYTTFRNDALESLPLTNYILDIIVERQYKIEFLKQAPNGEQIGVD